MSKAYRSKLFSSIKKLPIGLQDNYQAALEKHHFDLDIFVPQNFLNKKENGGKRYLRNRLVNADIYGNGKEQLGSIKCETKDFSNQYRQILKESENTVGSKRFQETYAKDIEQYIKLGYEEKRILPKRNIFEPSVLLEGVKDFHSILENGDPKVVKKENHFIERFHTDILKINKGYVSKEKKRKKSQEDISVVLPIINNSYRSAESENLVLKYDILKTEKTFRDMSSNKPKYQALKDYDSYIYYKDKKKRANNSVVFKNPDNISNDQQTIEEEIFVSSKGMKITPRTEKFIKYKKIITKIPPDEEEKEKPMKNANNDPPIDKKTAKAQQKMELDKLYNNIQTCSSYDKEAPNIISYAAKYLKRKFEPIE